MRAAFGRGFVVGAASAGAMSLSKGRITIGRMRNEADDAHELLPVDRPTQHPAHDGTLTFDRLSSVFAAGNKTRDDQPNHIRIQTRVPADVAQLWAHLCPAQVYTVGAAGDDGLVDRRRRAVELRAVRRDLGEGRAAHTTRRRLRARVLPGLRRVARYCGVRSRSCGGLAGICQRRKPLSYFSWYALASSIIFA